MFEEIRYVREGGEENEILTSNETETTGDEELFEKIKHGSELRKERSDQSHNVIEEDAAKGCLLAKK